MITILVYLITVLNCILLMLIRIILINLYIYILY